MNPRLVAAAVVGVLAIGYGATALALAPEDATLSAHGDGWDDAGGLRAAIEKENVAVRTLFTSPLALDAQPGRTVYVALGLERPYTTQEVDRLVRFWQEGGHLLVADQGEHMQDLASRFGVDVVPQQIFDPRFSADGSRLVSAVASLGGRDYALLANDPLQLASSTERTWEILARSGDDTFVDTDGDGEAGLGDRKGAVPLVLRHTAEGGGNVVLASQPGMFADLFTRPERHGVAARMQEAGIERPTENLDFALDLVLSLLPSGGTVVFDESRHVQPEPTQTFSRVLAPVVRLTADDQAAIELAGTSHDLPALWLFVVFLAAAGFVLVSRVPAAADWLHRHHLRRIDPPRSLQDGGAAAVELLVWEHVRQRHNLAVVEFDHLRPDERRALVDPALQPFIDGRHDKDSLEKTLSHLERELHIQEVATI